MTPLFGFLGSIGTTELVIILIVGVLLFGRKLPDVGRYLGKGIVEFKKGIKGIEDDIDTTGAAAQAPPAVLEQPRPPEKIKAAAPKFEQTQITPPQI
jgi:sec-independent protein translocase protein TatA